MEEGACVVSRDGDRRIKARLFLGGEERIVLIERAPGGMLETHFNHDGEVLRQVLSKADGGKALEDRLKEAVGGAGCKGAGEEPFEEVELQRGCPACGEPKPRRLAEGVAGLRGAVSVLPIYECRSCKAKSYRLTDEYLGFLVDTNRDMFTEEEKDSLGKDRGAFLNEIRENIIRIFASKRVLCIR